MLRMFLVTMCGFFIFFCTRWRSYTSLVGFLFLYIFPQINLPLPLLTLFLLFYFCCHPIFFFPLLGIFGSCCSVMFFSVFVISFNLLSTSPDTYICHCFYPLVKVSHGRIEIGIDVNTFCDFIWIPISLNN